MAMTVDGLPDKFFESLIMEDIKVDLLEPGRTRCSFKVPPRLLKGGNFMHGGVFGVVNVGGKYCCQTGTSLYTK
ncbi:unnamed protein product [Prunus armeniaca]